MSRSRPHRRPVRVRAKFVLGSAASACAVLTVVQLLLPALAEAHPRWSPSANSANSWPVVAAAWRWFGGDHQGPGGPGGTSPTTAPPAPPTATPTPTSAMAPPATGPAAPPTAPPPTVADPNPNCTLIVPPAPQSAAGLATPYRFLATNPRAGACHEANTDQSAFVEAAILDPASGSISIYRPLVVDDGTRPAIAPVAPRLPRGAVVAVWFGYQADVLSLRARHGHRGVMNFRFGPGSSGCVNGLPGSPFGQFAYCGAPRFFAAAHTAITAGKLTIPDLGTGRDGLPCPTTRDFGVVDQDQSDNLPTKYLATTDGRTAQFSSANAAALPGATVLTNASDNGLVDNKLDPVLGCTPATAPDLSAGGSPTPALALNELQAAAHQGAPVALVPPNDPMALVNSKTSLTKTNLYRVGVDQPPVNPATDTGAAYCLNLATVAVPRLGLDQALTSAAPSPDPAAASDLHGFLISRLNGSWTNLGCPDLTHFPTPTDAATAASPTPAPSTTAAPVTTAPATPPADPATAIPTATTTPATPATAATTTP